MNKEKIWERLSSLKTKITQGKEDVKALKNAVRDMQETLVELKNHLSKQLTIQTL